MTRKTKADWRPSRFQKTRDGRWVAARDRGYFSRLVGDLQVAGYERHYAAMLRAGWSISDAETLHSTECTEIWSLTSSGSIGRTPRTKTPKSMSSQT